MKTLEIKTPAKINLTLDILRKREDGFHDLSMIMQSVSLSDCIRLEEAQIGITVSCTDPRIPCDHSNLVYKAADALMNWASFQKGIKIHIEKNIPVEAGLAGGSANAAGVLKGLVELWNLSISNKELSEIGKTVGSDVPFCLLGGTALAEGTGDILTSLPPIPKYYLVLVKPEFGISTKEAFSMVEISGIEKHPDNAAMCRALEKGDRDALEKGLVNVFEPAAFRQYPQLSEIKADFMKQRADASLMSGSGPTVYGLFRSQTLAEEAFEYFRKRYGEVFIAETC